MTKTTINFIVALSLVFFTLSGLASPNTDNNNLSANNISGGLINKPSDIKAYIKHHLKDGHDFHLLSYTDEIGQNHHIGFPLPVVVWTSKGFKMFMSSEFHHDDLGSVVVDQHDIKLVKLHGIIYELNQDQIAVKFDDTNHAVNAVKVLDFSITKSVFGMLFAGLLIFLGFSSLAKGYRKSNIPTGSGRFLEPLVLYVRDEIALPNIGEKKYRQFMPYLLTVFFMIWLLNILGLTPLGFNVTGQIAITSCLGILTMIIYMTNGSKDFWVHTLWMPGVPVLLRPILAIVELVGFIIIKPFSLLVRLFANITAGHSVVMGIVALMIVLKAKFGAVGATGISFLLTLFLTLIELLVAFLQAYIFTMLSSLFIGMAVEEHDNH